VAAFPAGPLVDAALLAAVDPPRLAGSRCPGCGTVVFPVTSGCPRCSRPDPEQVALPATGVLWSWTEQCFPPKPPYRAPATGFVPFGVGYVDLGPVIVEGRLVPPGRAWRIGDPVRLTLVPAGPDASGGEVLSYAFEPDPSVHGGHHERR
jgi:uncharacterized protein